MTGDATCPRWLIVVRRDKPDLLRGLRRSFAPDGRVSVIFDRRQVEAVPAEADWRQQPRRKADRRAVPEGADRRRKQRRMPWTVKERALWQDAGFLVFSGG
jgi:hypothetical protein